MIQTCDGFSELDHAALHGVGACPTHIQQPQIADIAERLSTLQKVLSRRLFAAGSDLQVTWDRPNTGMAYSYAAHDTIDGLSVAFLRSKQQALLVERMMGRGTASHAESYRHPILEMRITPSHFAVELIMSPYAWWDQGNFIGKMQLQRHRDTLRALLQEMGDASVVGFWRGSDLHEAHLTSRQLLRGRFLEDWFSTFAPEHDWFRIGIWYEPHQVTRFGADFLPELGRRVIALSKLYHFVAWTSENNYHSFVKASGMNFPLAMPTRSL